MCASFINKNSIRVNLNRKGECCYLTRIKAGCCSKRGGHRLGRLLAQALRQFQATKPRHGRDEASKFRRNLGRDDDLLEEAPKQISLANAAEVNQHRRVGNDDHFENRAFRDRRSSASISSL